MFFTEGTFFWHKFNDELGKQLSKIVCWLIQSLSHFSKVIFDLITFIAKTVMTKAIMGDPQWK